MSELARGARRRSGAAVFFIAAATLLAGLVGCGSGDSGADETSSKTAPDSAAGAAAAKPEAAATGGPSTSPRSEAPRKKAQGDGSERSKTTGSEPSRRRELGRKAVKDCPSGLTPAQCGAMVEGFLNARGATPHSMEEPRDCLAGMSRAECEKVLEAQKAAAESAGSPVNVEECVRHPTPRCETVLRAMFDEKYVESLESGK